MGFDDDGRIVGLRVRNLADCGAYPHFGPVMPFISRKLACGPYRVPRVDYEWLAYATTTNPIGPYRGAGQPEVTNGLERIMDLAAAELGLDPRRAAPPQPAALRRAAVHDRRPASPTTAATTPRALARACELVDYDGVRAEQADAAGRRRPPGARRRRRLLRLVHRRPHRVRRGRRRPGRRHRSPFAAARSATARATPPPIAGRGRRPPGRRRRTTSATSTPTPTGCPAARARAGRVRPRWRAARRRPPPPRSSSGRGAWPPPASRPTPTDIVVMAAADGRPAGLGVAGVPGLGAWRGPTWPGRQAPRGSAPRSTCASTAPPTPPAPTSRWSRSTPRPAACGWSATWRSTTAAPC